MKSNFSACLSETLRFEGGWSDNRRDPGGKTMKGVTQRVYAAWRSSHGLPLQSVRLISDDELVSLYVTNIGFRFAAMTCLPASMPLYSMLR